MGSGKSSAGRELALRLGKRFIDTDRIVEEEEGMTIREIFYERGEEYFRKAEERALARVAEMRESVVACGGGTPCAEDNMKRMRSSGVVIYLRLTVEELTARLKGAQQERPLLATAEDDGMGRRVEELLRAREQWYEQADLIIDAGKIAEEEMAEAIVKALRRAEPLLPD